MSDFLLELRSEEIPARMQAGARVELERLFQREMDAAGVKVEDTTIWSTPRRLALIARGLPEATSAVTEELKGPPVGAPDQAIDGFCRKAGLERGELETRDVKGRATYFAVKNIPGRKTSAVLSQAIPAIVRDFSWPKSMRWGAASISTESLRWVRPLSGIVALLDNEVVECTVQGIKSGAVTLGHRFHHSGTITLKNVDDYAAMLRAGHVIVDQAERERLIREGAAQAAHDAGLTLIEDEGLVVENAGLTEWPVPLLGRFDEEFLEVPPEVIQLTARVNQKYFVCETADGKLANAFVCTANIDAEDGGAAIVDGNRKVLAARLSDARFFWDVDRKKTLAEHAKGLERITFHEKLGTVADKVDRVAQLARWLVEEGIVVPASPDMTKAQLADMAEQAVLLAKADLVTEMVGEFPELQGLMGGYYARAEGLPDAVADAIRDHYKPVGQGDDVPTAPVTVAVALADKLDTLISFFAINETPTGSKDPFALRRAALAVIQIIDKNSINLNILNIEPLNIERKNFINNLSQHDQAIQDFENITSDRISASRGGFFTVDNSVHSIVQADDPSKIDYLINAIIRRPGDLDKQLLKFFADRLKVQQREAGVRHDLIDAVFALGGEDDLVRLLARVKALQSFMETDDGANLLAGYKRAANILRKEEWQPVGDKPLSYTPEPAEKALMDALDFAEPKAEAAIAAEDFSGAMAALASLRTPIDRFFDEVTVNADEDFKRAHRLDLLAHFRAAVHKVADFSRIEG